MLALSEWYGGGLNDFRSKLVQHRTYSLVRDHRSTRLTVSVKYCSLVFQWILITWPPVTACVLSTLDVTTPSMSQSISIQCWYADYNWWMKKYWRVRFKVIEADGIEHEPVVADGFQILVAQRYSFVLTANQSVDNYCAHYRFSWLIHIWGSIFVIQGSRSTM